MEEESTYRGVLEGGQYLTFCIEDTECGIEVECVQEIISICNITKVPKAKKCLKGIINLRGSIIPVIDVRERFKKESVPYGELTCIVIVENREVLIGLVVDKVNEVIYLNHEELIEPVGYKNKELSGFMNKIGKVKGQPTRMLLDLDKLIYDEDL